LLSALIPGSGLVMGGRKKLGAFVLTLSIGLLVVGAQQLALSAYGRIFTCPRCHAHGNQSFALRGR
jgi:hypothetical protein